MENRITGETATIRLHGLATESIVDGPGYRTAVFAQGCPHRCEGCHNPGSHDPAGGTLWTLADVEKAFTGNPVLDGITLTGGEPFLQPDACAQLAFRAHQKALNVWTFSGFTYEELAARAQSNPAIRRLLDETDVLVDGPFLQAERSLDLDYRGSGNQRLIDMAKTRERGRVSLYTPPNW